MQKKISLLSAFLLVSFMQLLAQTSLSIPAQNINCGQQISVPITVTNFNNIVGLQFSIQWNPSELSYISETTIPELMTGINGFNTQNTAGGELGFSWVNVSPGAEVTKMDGDSIIFVDFIVVGNNFNTTTINFASTPSQIAGTQITNTGQIIDLPTLGVSSGTLTLVDTSMPTVTCPSNLAVTTLGTDTSVVVNNLTPTATDNCGMPAISYTISGATSGSGTGDASGEVFNVGLNIITYTVMDFQGNSTSCTMS